MFFLGLLIVLLCIDALLLIPLILIQKGKGSMGLGSLGGGTQMLFGGSGGQDLFQKVTWVLGSIFMAGSLFLSIMWSRSASKPYQLSEPVPAQSMPLERTAPQQKPVQEQAMPQPVQPELPKE